MCLHPEAILRGQILEEMHYYPFGLTMAGISSKAASSMENKKQKFQGQEFNNDFEIGMYEFKYRMHDCQTGRFWQADPLADKYVYNSTYAFSENHVTSHVELEGLEKISIQNLNKAGSFNHHKSKDLNTMVLNRKETLSSPKKVSYGKQNVIPDKAMNVIDLMPGEAKDNIKTVNFTKSVSESVTVSSGSIIGGDGVQFLELKTKNVSTQVNLYMDKVTDVTVIVSTNSTYTKILDDNIANNSITIDLTSTIPNQNLQIFQTMGTGDLAKDIKNLSPELQTSVTVATKENAQELKNAGKMTEEGLKNIRPKQ